MPTNKPTPQIVAASCGMRNVNARLAILATRDAAKRARRAKGYRGPLTRADLAKLATR
jgi:hypothetical protein